MAISSIIATEESIQHAVQQTRDRVHQLWREFQQSTREQGRTWSSSCTSNASCCCCCYSIQDEWEQLQILENSLSRQLKDITKVEDWEEEESKTKDYCASIVSGSNDGDSLWNKEIPMAQQPSCSCCCSAGACCFVEDKKSSCHPKDYFFSAESQEGTKSTAVASETHSSHSCIISTSWKSHSSSFPPFVRSAALPFHDTVECCATSIKKQEQEIPFSTSAGGPPPNILSSSSAQQSCCGVSLLTVDSNLVQLKEEELVVSTGSSSVIDMLLEWMSRIMFENTPYHVKPYFGDSNETSKMYRRSRQGGLCVCLSTMLLCDRLQTVLLSSSWGGSSNPHFEPARIILLVLNILPPLVATWVEVHFPHEIDETSIAFAICVVFLIIPAVY